MENLSDKLKEAESKIEAKEKEMEQQPKMTQEQANAVMNIAKDPKSFIGAKVSQHINDLIETDSEVGEQFTNLAKDTVQSQIGTFDTQNKLQNKKNYYELNEKDVLSMGGDKSSTKGQQFSIVMIKRFFWILFMATLGTFFIPSMSVIVELFQGISFKNIEKVEYESKNGKKTEWVIKKHKLGILGTVIGWIVGLAFWGVEIFLIVKFPVVFLILAIVVFIVVLLINTIFGIKWNFLKKIFKRDREEKTETKTEVEVEVEDKDATEIEIDTDN